MNVKNAQRDAVRMTAGYLGAYMSSELGEHVPPPSLPSQRYVGKSFTDQNLDEALRSPLVKVKVANKEGQPDPMGIGLKAMLATVDLNVKTAARQSLQDAMVADDRITGWRRAVRGTCDACMGAADGSTLPPGTPLDIHPNCDCVSEAVVPTFRYEGPANREVEAQVKALSERFPKADGRVRMTPEIKGHEVGGVSNNGIQFGPKFYDDAYMQTWVDSLKNLVYTNFKTVAEARQTIVVHEFGHVLEKQLANLNADVWRELHKIATEPVFVEGLGKEVPRWQANLLAPSPYANESQFEFIAESFTEYMDKGTGARESSRKIGEILEREFGRKG
jgi:hypothetical protein